ncbi:MAG: excisionase family DNA-binding protein [Chloroflexi bacterium]|nr:excisionase family DNA-binding protein [Chloroflexota bacterium]
MVTIDVHPPTEKAASQARESYEKLVRFVEPKRPLTFVVSDAEHKESIQLPAEVVELLKKVLEAMVAGHGVTLIPLHAELTTMEAADILNVSRPYLIKLLEADEIPYRRVGRHRRVRMEDVLTYKKNIDSAREAILDQMVAEAEELGLYD